MTWAETEKQISDIISSKGVATAKAALLSSQAPQGEPMFDSRFPQQKKSLTK